MTSHKAPASRPHDDAMADLIKADPDLTDVYLATALEEANLPGGQFALLAAQRQIALAQGKAT
jgi:DNA-binding phage protein